MVAHLIIIGFVTVAHYQKNSTYEQVTGYIDRSKYNLDVNDGGGQYDNHGQGKPTGASCKGYPYFVGMIEPSSNRFCMRCCQNKVILSLIVKASFFYSSKINLFLYYFRRIALQVALNMDACVSFPVITLAM